VGGGPWRLKTQHRCKGTVKRDGKAGYLLHKKKKKIQAAPRETAKMPSKKKKHSFSCKPVAKAWRQRPSPGGKREPPPPPPPQKTKKPPKKKKSPTPTPPPPPPPQTPPPPQKRSRVRLLHADTEKRKKTLLNLGKEKGPKGRGPITTYQTTPYRSLTWGNQKPNLTSRKKAWSYLRGSCLRTLKEVLLQFPGRLENSNPQEGEEKPA